MVFNGYAEYYDLLYKDKNYEAEADYIDKILQSYAPMCKCILELGCGTGRHAEILSHKGYEITGIDMSNEMLKKANERAKSNDKIKFHLSNIQTFSLNEEFDAVMAWFHVMSYQNSYEAFCKVLSNVYNHLKKGGIFVFDCWYGPAVLLQIPEHRVKRLKDEKIYVTRIAEPVLRENDNIVEVHYDVFIEKKSVSGGEKSIIEIREQHNMRYFFLDEVKMLAKNMKFSFVEAFEFMTNNSLGKNTWGACFVLKK